jgi:predicted O-methyltransferase YrrM
MKDRADAILRPVQAAYLERLLPPADELVREMERFAAEHEVPISDPEVGRFLQILTRLVGAERVLEVGTAIGYGTVCMARGSAMARVVTIDRDSEALTRARDYLGRAGLLDRVELLEGEASRLLPELEGTFDLVYLDGDKTEYRRCLDLALPKLRVGGAVVVDNLLFKGWVADPGEEEEEDPRVVALQAFNGYFMIHPQLASVVLPLGDGLGVATKIRPLISEVGGPF